MSIGAIGGRHAQIRLKGRYDGDITRDIALHAYRRMGEDGRSRGCPPYPTSGAGQLPACSANIEASVTIAARDRPGIGTDAERGKRAQELFDECIVGGVDRYAARRCAFKPADVQDTRTVHDSRSARRAEMDRPAFSRGQFRGPLEADFSSPSRGNDETRVVDPQARRCLAPVPFERHIEEPFVAGQGFLAVLAPTGFDRTARGNRVRERSDQSRRCGHRSVDPADRLAGTQLCLLRHRDAQYSRRWSR